MVPPTNGSNATDKQGQASTDSIRAVQTSLPIEDSESEIEGKERDYYPDVSDLNEVKIEPVPDAVICVNHRCQSDDKLARLHGVRKRPIVVCPDHLAEGVAKYRKNNHC